MHHFPDKNTPVLKVTKKGNKTVAIEARLILHVAREGKFYVASCKDLQLVSQGLKRNEALENLKTAVELFFFTCLDLDTLDPTLTELGWKCVEAGSESEECLQGFPTELPKTPPAFVINAMNNMGTDVSMRMTW